MNPYNNFSLNVINVNMYSPSHYRITQKKIQSSSTKISSPYYKNSHSYSLIKKSQVFNKLQ
jgi:hypothetical protein